MLRWFEGSLPWLIGAWVAYGEAHFGERASQAVDATGWKLATIKQCVWVHEQVPESRREPALSWSHHREIADLAPAAQRSWLRKAKDQDLSVDALRRAINHAKHPDAVDCWLLVRCTNEADREALAAKLEAEGRSVRRP